MYDLLTFKEMRISAMSDAMNKKDKRISELETYVFELCDKDCPEDYKLVVKNQVFSREDIWPYKHRIQLPGQCDFIGQVSDEAKGKHE